MHRLLLAFFAAIVGFALDSCPTARGQNMAPPFNAGYTVTDLGTLPGVTFNSGICFLNNTTLLFGDNADSPAGVIRQVTVVRNAGGQVTGFTGPAVTYKNAPDIDAGLAIDANGVLFATTWPTNMLHMFKVGGGLPPSKTVALTPLGVLPTTGGVNFVPAGFPGAGGCRIISYATDNIYSCTLTSDGLGTYNVSGVSLQSNLNAQGPTSILYVPSGSPIFNPNRQYTIACEFNAGQVSVYQLDASGNPIFATRTGFVVNFSGAAGSTFDPVSGDALFSTMDGSNKILRVSGFRPGGGGGGGGSGGSGAGGSGEGKYGGPHDTEGGFMGVRPQPDGLTMLQGPFADGGVNFRVRNVAPRPAVDAEPAREAALDPLVWSVLAGLALAAAALTAARSARSS